MNNATATQNADSSAADPDVPQTNKLNESTPQRLPKRQTTKSKEWLPDGWTCEVKVRTSGSSSGMKYKIYTDPISGQKFLSKPRVLSHLAKINGSPAVQREVSNLVEKYATKADESQKSKVNEKKTISRRMSSEYEVMSRTPVNGLPKGWIKEIRMRKGGIPEKNDPYYLDPLSDYAFLSKKDALRYLDSGDTRKCALKPLKRNINEDKYHLTSSGGKSVKAEPVSDWLPVGWTVKVNYKSNGLKYKSYHEPATGKKFYSKPMVLNYLAGGTTSNNNSRKRKENKPKRSSNKSAVIKNADFTEEITTTPAEGLPPGWIKEVRTKIYATHKRSDPFYIDPVSGYIFHSKVDAFRYLESGDVNLCAIRPKIKDQDRNEVPVFTHDVQKVQTEDKEGETSTVKQQNDESTLARVVPKVEENEDQGSGINLEKVAEDDGQLSYDIPEDDNWTDGQTEAYRILDFAVKTLTNETAMKVEVKGECDL